MQSGNKPKVAVFMVTYNHAPFIERAVEGVLMQRTDFPVKLFIGEDCSTDGTREICRRYAEKYPEKIELLPTEKNIGGIANAQRVYPACFAYGDYTAMCEGDDYWTDPLKLQKQVDFFEANRDFAVCFHNVWVVYENEDRQPHLLHRKKIPDVTVFEDLARENYIATPSCVFRNNLFESFPNCFLQMPLGDWILHLLNAQFGKIKYLDHTMAVYRIHDKGMWGREPIEKRLLGVAKVIKTSREYFHPRGNREFTETLNETYKNFSSALFPMFDAGNYEEFRYYYREIIDNKSFISLRSFCALTVRYVMSYLPFVRDFY